MTNTPSNAKSTDDAIVYRTELRFNSIYVIESLRDGEPKTGQDLYDSVIGPGASSFGTSMHKQVVAVRTENDLLAQLAVIAYAARRANHHPIIHIEAHGDESGIQLADGTAVLWRTITPRLAEINQACRMNLIVVAMACNGWGLTYALMPSERAPVNMVIGPPESVTASAISKATRLFYTSLLATMDLNAALEAMNEGVPYSQWRIKPGTAEILFCRVFRRYMEEFLTPSSVQERENALVARIAAVRQLDVVQTSHLRAEIRPKLTDARWWYHHFREHFLMFDLFPEIANHFGLSFDHCIRRSPEGDA